MVIYVCLCIMHVHMLSCDAYYVYVSSSVLHHSALYKVVLFALCNVSKLFLIGCWFSMLLSQ